jgi:ubiquinone biosynthesis protein COQ9
MDDSAFDKALIAAAFDLAGRTGWSRLSVAAAATEASLPLARARARFPGRHSVLSRFGVMADQAALVDTAPDSSTRDRLFDMLMRRIDVLQEHREGLLALLRYLPTDPPLGILLALATRRSMRWILEAAGVSARGLRGELRVRGLVAVWLWTVRAWRADESADLSATMAALDHALRRAEQAAGWLDGRSIGGEPVAGKGQSGHDDEPDLPSAPLDTPPEPPPSPPGVI